MNFYPLIVHVAAAYTCPEDVVATEIEDRILALGELTERVRSAGEMPLRDERVYEAYILPGIQVFEVLYAGVAGLGHDLCMLLAAILDRAKSDAAADLEEGQPLADIGLWNSGPNFLDSASAWLAYRRRTLVLCGVTAESFPEQAAKVFPDIILSDQFPQCLHTLNGGVEAFMPIVIDALSKLNDSLLETVGTDPIELGLKRFSAAVGYATTMEGSADRNLDFTFEFDGPNGRFNKVCAPHMKLCASAMPGDSEYYYNRIYFAFDSKASRPSIYVGHAGKHL